MKALASAVSARISRIQPYDFFVLCCRLNFLIGMTVGAIISVAAEITAMVVFFYPWVPILWKPINGVAWQYGWATQILFTADSIMTHLPTLFFGLATTLFFAGIGRMFRSCIRDLDRFVRRHAN
ncbi:MAG: hypothetical protein HYT41_00670 [Candidatus Sungbacteria bacterium]|nr:hypothetical protein [Candidatus Sungbacteria bacterium]